MSNRDGLGPSIFCQSREGMVEKFSFHVRVRNSVLIFVHESVFLYLYLDLTMSHFEGKV